MHLAISFTKKNRIRIDVNTHTQEKMNFKYYSILSNEKKPKSKLSASFRFVLARFWFSMKSKSFVKTITIEWIFHTLLHFLRHSFFLNEWVLLYNFSSVQRIQDLMFHFDDRKKRAANTFAYAHRHSRWLGNSINGRYFDTFTRLRVLE